MNINASEKCAYEHEICLTNVNSQCRLWLTLFLWFYICLFFFFCISRGYSWHDMLPEYIQHLLWFCRGEAVPDVIGPPLSQVGGTFDHEESNQHRWALRKGEWSLSHQLLLEHYVNCAYYLFCKHRILSWIDCSWETGICSLLQAKSRVCHMSPSLKHHLILQHAPDMTQLLLLRNAT